MLCSILQICTWVYKSLNPPLAHICQFVHSYGKIVEHLCRIFAMKISTRYYFTLIREHHLSSVREVEMCDILLYIQLTAVNVVSQKIDSLLFFMIKLASENAFSSIMFYLQMVRQNIFFPILSHKFFIKCAVKVSKIG